MSLLKYIKPESLNRCFADWVYSFMPEKSRDMTISLDGKTVCSTLKMDKIESPLHIIIAQICEPGLTLAQRCTDDKSNEIPAVQELLKELKIKGQIVVADALNVIFVQQPIAEAYDQLFRESTERYNARQKRNDRKIGDYYEHLFGCKPCNTVKVNALDQKSFYEVVVQIGKREDSGIGMEDEG